MADYPLGLVDRQHVLLASTGRATPTTGILARRCRHCRSSSSTRNLHSSPPWPSPTSYLLAALLPAVALAHGSISDPMPAFSDIYNKNAPAAYKSGTPGQYTGTEGIKDLADAAGSTCGNTDANAAAVAAPSNGIVTFDVSAVHIGPCELWLDDSQEANATNCWATYADKTIPLDYSQCTGSQCQVRWIWLATHNDPWEIFDNCVNVAGGGTDEAATETPTSDASSDSTPGTVAPANVSTSSSSACSYRGNAGNEQYDNWCEANCAAGYCSDSICEAC